MSNERAKKGRTGIGKEDEIMKLAKVHGLITLFLAVLLCVPAWAANNASSNTAVPGTVNYVEGKAYVADQPLDKDSIGKTTLAVGQTLNTNTGKTEVLLTPGVFLRVGDNSAAQMVAAGLENTEVRLLQGHAMVEVDQIFPQNFLRIDEGSASARLMKPGLYDFDLQQNVMRVFDGEAMVNTADRQVTLKAGHELEVAAGASEKPAKFDKKAENGDDLYRWSSLRSDYVAEANVDAAHIIYAGGWGPYWGAGFWGPGWGWGPYGWGGWYWDPWFSAYTFMPGAGIFYSPFGWGFYSPALVYRAPFYAGHVYHTFNAANVAAWGPGVHYATSKSYAHGVYTGAGADRGAFHSGPVMARGAGFHGGEGGFHGGEGGFHGGGGGFHGGGMTAR
jgi:hypothetical protein